MKKILVFMLSIIVVFLLVLNLLIYFIKVQALDKKIFQIK